MRLKALNRIVVVLACAGALQSCGEDSTTAPPIVPLPIGTGYWYMHTADDSALSTTISTRPVGVALERTQIDSAWINVVADGTYEQRYWLQVFISGVLDRKETVIDHGRWVLAGAGYAFTSNVRERAFLVTPTASGRLLTLEAMVFYTDAPETVGDYRRTRP